MKIQKEQMSNTARKIGMGVRFCSLLFVLLFVLSACGNENNTSSDNTRKQEAAKEETEAGQAAEKPSENMEKSGDSAGRILIAYFTLADNYEKPLDMDATTQASINIENKELIGNTEYLANAIQEKTGGDLFSVVVKNPYPNDYDKIIDMGSDEQKEDARPELSSHVEKMEQYQTVYLGFPIWWYTMPQAMFTFLEEYDFSGKTIIPFTTHGGYGVGSSVEDIQKLCPDSNVIEDIFEAERDDDLSGQSKKISTWIDKLEREKQ